MLSYFPNFNVNGDSVWIISGYLLSGWRTNSYVATKWGPETKLPKTDTVTKPGFYPYFGSVYGVKLQKDEAGRVRAIGEYIG